MYIYVDFLNLFETETHNFWIFIAPKGLSVKVELVFLLK